MPNSQEYDAVVLPASEGRLAKFYTAFDRRKEENRKFASCFRSGQRSAEDERRALAQILSTAGQMLEGYPADSKVAGVGPEKRELCQKAILAEKRALAALIGMSECGLRLLGLSSVGAARDYYEKQKTKGVLMSAVIPLKNREWHLT